MLPLLDFVIIRWECLSIMNFVTQWRGVMLSIQTLCQPVIYINVMLDFINNLPTEANNPYTALKQEVYNNYFENPARIDYNYFVHITNCILTLDFQFQALCITRSQNCPKCAKCNGLGYMMEQHLNNPNYNQPTTITLGKPSPKNEDHGPPNRAYVAEEEKPAEVYIAEETDLFLNSNSMFDWYAMVVIELNYKSTTVFIDAMQEESYAVLLTDIKTLLDSGCTSHIIQVINTSEHIMKIKLSM